MSYPLRGNEKVQIESLEMCIKLKPNGHRRMYTIDKQSKGLSKAVPGTRGKGTQPVCLALVVSSQAGLLQN